MFIPGDAGIQPALQGMVFCLLAFVGFEAAAPLAEETRDPKRNTRRAIVWSAILIGIFYVFCYYAATVYFGPDKMADFFAANDGNPWGGMAEEVLPGIGSYLVTIAILNSCLANANSGANASTRSVFALGRSRLIPAAFGTVHPTHRTPATAIHLQAIVGIIIAVGLSLYLGNAVPGRPGAAQHLLHDRLRDRPVVRRRCTWPSTSRPSATSGASSATSSTGSST